MRCWGFNSNGELGLGNTGHVGGIWGPLPPPPTKGGDPDRGGLAGDPAHGEAGQTPLPDRCEGERRRGPHAFVGVAELAPDHVGGLLGLELAGPADRRAAHAGIGIAAGEPL